MESVADWSFLGGAALEAAMMNDGSRLDLLLPAWHTGIIGHRPPPQAITHHPNTSQPTLLAVMAANDLKYYELYRRSRYCMRAWEHVKEHAG